MIIINNVNLSLDTDFSHLDKIVAKELKIDKSKIKSATLHKKSVDARHKNNVHFCCSFLVELDINEEKIVSKIPKAQIYVKKDYIWLSSEKETKNRPVVVGFGPAGMFCALALAKAGLKPIVLERGEDADKRTKTVENFLQGGNLNPESNVQFGEGGAGTFSDGKLNTGISDVRCRAVLETFVENGADKKILYEAKPHIGTDILVSVVKNIRKQIISLGGEVLFNTKFEDFKEENGKIISITANDKEILCNNLVLATGHSARDVFSLLKTKGTKMVKKPFAVGVRIEHLQSDINKALYGEFWNHPKLSAADYKMAVHLQNGRGVYTFCMCPGGEVINASSEEGGIAVNGMSNSRRDGENANSALLVGLEPEDFEGDILEGCRFQERIEKKAYSLFKGAVPITTVGAFVFGEKFELGKVKPTVKPDFKYADLKEIYPEFITESLKEGIKLFDKKIKGFANSDAVITAPETRSSSPIRIVRNDAFQSESVNGLYPCGEGAGYAGGIMSAAVDGLKVAEEIIKNIN